MLEKLVFILPGKSYSRIFRTNDGLYYFESLYVREDSRRRGIGTKMLYQAISCIKVYPELDIRKVSKVAQRIATKAGYLKIKESERYVGCELWTHEKEKIDIDTPFNVANKTFYSTDKLKTHVYYLR